MKLRVALVGFLVGIGTSVAMSAALTPPKDPYHRVIAPRECSLGGYYYQDRAGRIYDCETLRLAF